MPFLNVFGSQMRTYKHTHVCNPCHISM